MRPRRFPTSTPARSLFHWTFAVALGTTAAVVTAALAPEWSVSVSTCLACMILTAAALHDAVSGRIANRLTYGAIAVGFACAATATFAPALAPLVGGPGLLGAATAFAIVALVGGAGFCLGGFGAADLKLALALAPFIGIVGVFLTVVLASVAVGLLFVVDVASARRFVPSIQIVLRPVLSWHVGEPVGRPVTFRRSRLPMAPGFLVGFLLLPTVGAALASAEWIP